MTNYKNNHFTEETSWKISPYVLLLVISGLAVLMSTLINDILIKLGNSIDTCLSPPSCDGKDFDQNISTFDRETTIVGVLGPPALGGMALFYIFYVLVNLQGQNALIKQQKRSAQLTAPLLDDPANKNANSSLGSFSKTQMYLKLLELCGTGLLVFGVAGTLSIMALNCNSAMFEVLHLPNHNLANSTLVFPITGNSTNTTQILDELNQLSGNYASIFSDLFYASLAASGVIVIATAAVGLSSKITCCTSWQHKNRSNEQTQEYLNLRRPEHGNRVRINV